MNLPRAPPVYRLDRPLEMWEILSDTTREPGPDEDPEMVLSVDRLVSD